MQKNKNASILLWSIFLSLIIASLFIHISTKIWKVIEENRKIENEIKKDREKNRLLKENNLENINLSKNEKIIFESEKYFEKSLKKDEELNINIDKETNINIKLNPEAIVNYSTWINLSNMWEKIFLKWEKTVTLGSWSILQIKNIWWIAKVELFSEKDISFPYKRYKIIKEIGNKIVEKESGIIKK